MASGSRVAESKARQRARIGATVAEEKAARKDRAERLREFFGMGKLEWPVVEPDAQHICDLIANVTQFQTYRGTILTMNIPNAYAQDALLTKQCNRIYLRVYSLDDLDALMDELDA